MEPYTLSGLVTIFACLFTFYLAYNVGSQRRTHKVTALEVTDIRDILIANRVHLNMLENMVIYIPLLWLATAFGPSFASGVIGLIWISSRVWYSFSYMNDPKSRQMPFIIGAVCTAITALISLYGVIV